MKNLVINVNETFGTLMFLGTVEKFLYVDGKKTDKVEGYNYKLASSTQGEEVTIFVPGDRKNFNFCEPVELQGVEVNTMIQESGKEGKFKTVKYTFKAKDVKSNKGGGQRQ